MTSLREHTKNSPVWVHWDSWRKRVADYEKLSRAMWSWLEEKLEGEPPENIGSGDMELCRGWLFGNILLIADGQETIGPDAMKKVVGESEGIMVVAYGGEPGLSRYLAKVIKEVKKKPEWTLLESSTAQLKSIESQRELRRIAKEVDDALVSIELMHAFPGHCELCPV